MRLYYSIIVFLCSLLSFSQGFKVRHYLPGVKTHMSKAIFEAIPGNYISGGIIVDSTNGVYCNQLCIMGLNSQGQIQWVKKYGNLKFEYLNNGFISRSFYKQGSFIYYAGAAVDSNNVYLGVFIKFNLNGDTLWQKRFYDPNDYVYPQMLTGSIDGGFLLTGMFEDPVNVGRRILLIKTDANGNELWRKDIGKTAPNVNDGKALVQDSASKKIVIVGYQYLFSNNIFDNVVIVDSLGNQSQRFNYVNSIGALLKDVIQTKDKKIVAVGQKYSAQTIGGNNLMKSYIVKFDVNNPGTPLWMFTAIDTLSNANLFTCLTELNNGDVVVGGVLDTSYINFHPENQLTRLIKIRPDGTIKSKWYYNYKTNLPMSDNRQGLQSIQTTSDGSLIGAIECFNFPNPNPFFFVKWDSLGCDSTLTYCQAVAMGLEKNYSGNPDISIYPNPSQGLFYLSIPEAETGRELWVNVADLSGRIVKRMEVEQSKQPLDLKELRSGVYIVTISNQKRTLYTAKLVKQE